MAAPRYYIAHDGSRNPRRGAAVYDSLGILTLSLGALVAIAGFASQSPLVGVAFGAAAVLAAISLHATAVVMRWMAAMYELAARGFEPEYPLPQDSGAPPVDPGRPHRRAA